MNIMLTEISSLTLDIQEVAVGPQDGGDSFSGVLRQQYSEASEKSPQATEFKAFIENISASGESQPLPLQVTEQTLWREFLAADVIRVSSDSDSVVMPGEEVPAGASVPLAETALALPAVAQGMDAIGYKLPADGSNLPDITPGNAITAQPVNHTVAGSDARMALVETNGQPVKRLAPDSATAITQKLPASEAMRPEFVAPSVAALRSVFAPGQNPAAAVVPGNIHSNSGLEAAVSPQTLATSPSLSNGLTASVIEPGLQQPSQPTVSATAPPATAPELPITMPSPAGPEAPATSPQEAAPRLAQSRLALVAGQDPAVVDAANATPVPSRDTALLAETQISRDLLAGFEGRNNETVIQSASVNVQLASNQLQSNATLSPYGQAVAVAAPGSPHASAALPPQLESMSLARGMDAGELGSNLGDRINWMVNQKNNTATIRLDPPMLGKLDVQVRITDDATLISINTQHAQTRDMIDSASVRLRELLQESGYQNVNVDVSHREDQQAGHSALADESGSMPPQDEAARREEADFDTQQQGRFIRGDGLLDTFA